MTRPIIYPGRIPKAKLLRLNLQTKDKNLKPLKNVRNKFNFRILISYQFHSSINTFNSVPASMEGVMPQQFYKFLININGFVKFSLLRFYHLSSSLNEQANFEKQHYHIVSQNLLVIFHSPISPVGSKYQEGPEYS